MLVKESGGPPGPAASLHRLNIFVVEPVALSRRRCERDELSEIAVGER